jgi:hypothetical protein
MASSYSRFTWEWKPECSLCRHKILVKLPIDQLVTAQDGCLGASAYCSAGKRLTFDGRCIEQNGRDHVNDDNYYSTALSTAAQAAHWQLES